MLAIALITVIVTFTIASIGLLVFHEVLRERNMYPIGSRWKEY